MKNYFNLKIIIIVVISILVGYLIRDRTENILKISSSKHNFDKIDKRLDSEHDQILDAVDKLYDACEKHWKTEDDMYEKGRKGMPKGHKDISKEWNEHRQDHIDVLQNIKNMKNSIIKHINEKDTRHFHWINDI